MTKSIKHEEYTCKGRHVTLDAAQLSPDFYETMLFRSSDGLDITSKTAKTEAEALEQFAGIRAAYPPDNERPAPVPVQLSGKYAKLRDDVRKAAQIGREAAAQVDDSGTCNRDSAALLLPRWKEALVKQACKEADCGCFTWKPFGTKYFVVCACIPGQAYKQEVAAEAMTAAFREMGYDALTYCQMD